MPKEAAPPEREFDNEEVYPLMEQLVADAVEALPEFPGFARRDGFLHGCPDPKGNPIEGWVTIELTYDFSTAVSETPLVREEYTDTLREAWIDAGYEITWDEASPDEDQYNLSASRSDGITLWWRVWGLTGLTIQSGCVPISGDDKYPAYLPPAGGVPLNAESDPFGNALDPSVYAAEASSDEATDEAAVQPFDNAVAAHHAPLGINPFGSQL
ncbi:hypothetical protein [Glycomyces endophyticus]